MKVKELTKEVRKTIGTPFHHAGRISGLSGGLDCGGVIIVALQSLGYEVHDKEHYRRGDGLKDMVEILELNSFQKKSNAMPSPFLEGDIILVRSSQIYHHLVYYTDTDTIVHAWVTTGINKVVETAFSPDWIDSIHSIWRHKDLE